MKKFEDPVMKVSLFSENILTDASGVGDIKLHEGTEEAAGAALISTKLADLYSVSYADMAK